MPYKVDTSPPSLYVSSLFSTLSLLKRLKKPDITFANRQWILDQYPGAVVGDLMEAVIVKHCTFYTRVINSFATNQTLLFTPRVTRAVIFCKTADFLLLAVRCRNLRELVLVRTDPEISMDDILKMPSISKILFITHPHHVILRIKDLRRLWSPHLLDSSRKIIEEHLLSVSCGSSSAASTSRAATISKNYANPVELYLSGIPLKLAEIQNILLTYPRIQVLRHRHLLAALYSLHKDSDTNDLSPYELRNLDYIRWDVHDLIQHSSPEEILQTENEVIEAIRMALLICPKIRVVTITYNFDTPPPPKHALDLLCSLEVIEGLTISSNHNIPDINRRLYGFLEKHGNTIKTLELDNFVSLDIELILFYCQNMMSLFLYDVSFMREVRRPLEFDNIELHELRDLCVCNQIDFPCRLWSIMLTSHALSIIKLFNVSVANETLDEVTALNYWKQLRGLFLVNCDNLRLRHIMNLLLSDNNLQEIDILFCTGITEEDKHMIERYITETSLYIKHRIRCWS